ncbi:MAG TPA: hypothetical protein VFD23_04625 [Clostridia bacterium]|nr:hypothetical protein [Clostridia bacterium]
MKNRLIYFFKTQLTVTLVFNFFLLLAYIPFIVFSFVVFNILDVQKGLDLYAYVACTVPIIVFFCCGVYYKNAKTYYVSSLTPRNVLLGTGKKGAIKPPIIRPKNIIMQYLPIVFPLMYTLACSFFYEKARFNPFVLLIHIPYNWIFLTPAWYMIFGESRLNSLTLPIVLPAVSYFFFLIGYLLGHKPFFNRFQR